MSTDPNVKMAIFEKVIQWNVKMSGWLKGEMCNFSTDKILKCHYVKVLQRHHVKKI